MVDHRQGPTGGDHRLRWHTVPEVSGSTDDVLLDHGHLGPEAGGVGGGAVTSRATADDHESLCHEPTGYRQPHEGGSAGRVVTESSSAATFQWAESLISGEQLPGESEADDGDAGGH